MPGTPRNRLTRLVSWLCGVAAASGLVAVACGRTAVSPEAPLRLVLAGAPSTFDPQRNVDELTRMVLANFYEPLVDLDANLELRPRLALSWKSPSETEWWFLLREGVVFHDGRPFGAQDVKATLDRARTLVDGFAAEADIHAITGVRVVDDRNVVVTTSSPRPLLLVKLAGVAMLPRDAPAAVIWRPNGTGPWVFSGGATGSTGGPIRGRRFDRYWGPKPAFAELRIDAAPEESERTRAALEGADVTSPLPRSALDAAGQPRGPFRAVRHPTLTVAYLTCRVSRAFGGGATPFGDVRVRRAVSLALDRERLVQDGLDGEGRAVWQLAPPGILGFQPALARGRADPAEARRLLAEAGHPRGFASVLVAEARRERVARELARQLGEAGIRLGVEVHPPDEVFRRTMFGLAPLALSSATIATGDVSSLYESHLHSASTESAFGGQNWSKYSDALVDADIERVSRETRPGVRAELLAGITRRALEDLPYVPLYSPDWTYGVKTSLAFSPRLDRAVLAADVSRVPR